MAYVRIDQIVDVEGNIKPARLQTINDIIEALLVTRQGTIPGSRGYGLSQDFIDMSPPKAANLIAVELSAALKKYVPEIRVDRVAATLEDSGTMALSIYIGGGN